MAGTSPAIHDHWKFGGRLSAPERGAVWRKQDLRAQPSRGRACGTAFRNSCGASSRGRCLPAASFSSAPVAPDPHCYRERRPARASLSVSRVEEIGVANAIPGRNHRPASTIPLTKEPLIVQSVQFDTSWFETQATPAPHHEERIPHPEERPIG